MATAPHFIIMGAMKCATTTLHEQLNAQPGVFMSEPKEPNFFSDDDQYQRGFDWYEGLFAAAAPGDICGESSTHYTKLPTYPRAVERLRQYQPDVKLIYVMRHPVDRLISQYIHEWSQKTVSGSLSQALKRRPELYQYSLYSMQLLPYLETFGPDNVLPVFFDRLKQHPQAELTRIGKFIGCPQPAQWQESTGHRHVTKERLRDSAWRDALVNAPVLSSIRQHLVPQSVRDWVKSLWQMQQRPELSADETAWLQEKLDPDLQTLGRWLGLDLRCENFCEVTLAPLTGWVSDQLPETVLTHSRAAV
ncbi:MAG: sulfotransferase [Cyanobacteria bacterium J06614_10]